MHYIVFDLEWNIAGRANKVDPAVQAAMPFEIMEIGAVKLDEQFRPIGRFSTFVKPKYYTILSGYVAAVTRRMQQSMSYGQAFPEAAQSFRKFCGEDFIFCTWSESDISTLHMNLDFYGLSAMLPPWSLDVQYLFDALIERSGMQRSIEYAIDFLRVSKNQPFHQAVSDAHYTGRILAEIVAIIQKENGGGDVITPFLVDPALPRSHTVGLPEAGSMDEAVAQAAAVPAVCPSCGAALAPLMPWRVRRRSAEAIFACDQHGRIAARLRAKPRPGGRLGCQLSFRVLRYLEELRSENPENGDAENGSAGEEAASATAAGESGSGFLNGDMAPASAGAAMAVGEPDV